MYTKETSMRDFKRNVLAERRREPPDGGIFIERASKETHIHKKQPPKENYLQNVAKGRRKAAYSSARVAFRLSRVVLTKHTYTRERPP